MIKSITVTNHYGESLELILARPELSGFAVLFAEGLGPPKSTINTTAASTGDGAIFNSARMTQRNITLDLLFISNGYETIENIRHKSYKFFPVKKKIKLQIEADTRTTFIEGYVESNEPTIFSSNEGCQISIICPNPYFESAKYDNTTIFGDEEPLFEFYFSNESLTESLIEMSSITTSTSKNVFNEGDADVGITIKILATGSVENVTIHNLDTRESMMIDTAKMQAYTGSGIIAGDLITITTGVGNKSITLLRNGVYTNILNCLDRNADWFIIAPGDNTFAYTADSGLDHLLVHIENKIMYEGV